MTYAEKLKSPKWQKKRLEIFQRDNYTCQHCNSQDNPLNCHHHYYVANKDPWNYPNEALLTLCDDCHKTEEHFKQAFKDFVASFLADRGSYFDLFDHLMCFDIMKISDFPNDLHRA